MIENINLENKTEHCINLLEVLRDFDKNNRNWKEFQLNAHLKFFKVYYYTRLAKLLIEDKFLERKRISGRRYSYRFIFPREPLIMDADFLLSKAKKLSRMNELQQKPKLTNNDWVNEELTIPHLVVKAKDIFTRCFVFCPEIQRFFYVTGNQHKGNNITLIFRQNEHTQIDNRLTFNSDDNVIVIIPEIDANDSLHVEYVKKIILSMPDETLLKELSNRKYSGKISKSIEF